MFEVYIHVPFCLRRCGYCDFNTYTAVDLGGGASRGNYAAMTIHEMRLVRDWQERHGSAEPPASTVFFGGGTPTILPADDLIAILNAIRELWGVEDGAEITTEANPDTVDAATIRALADGGFTRVSFGMQSAVPHVLRTLDRTHTPANVEAGVRAAEAAGLRSSVDLIYGAPGESLEDWRTSVRTAIDLDVNHISAYALTVEPTTKMGRQIAAGVLPKPDDDDEAAKYEIADELFSAAGLQWYEISNWARPGYESRHNLGYWRNVDWAGIGPGAHSHYNRVEPASCRSESERSARPHGSSPQDCDVHGAIRSWDLAHPRLWSERVNAGQVPWAGSESITPMEALEETIMLGLRLREGLDLMALRTSLDIGGTSSAALDAGVAELEREGLVERRGSRLIPTLRGRLLNDAVIERMFDCCGL
ncbi:coproporphyrinogen III oxidase [Bifidobacterium pullorum subsp. saeculare]|uniref:radical SAM family heme chaperone HemW n=1 Tax=Bifidobacterium pullorum TaxID=78448 RepID=UPI0019566060|nr:radical SAM family heme chaperone HemW [Bifidobacterium pullorum]MBM6729702.1 coproporphyrinogen III oxidase [Bifidobacterium pullorum subsp. saeculare]